MAEQFANLFSTTLASNYTSGSGSISVTSATGAPSTGTFSLTILNASTGAVILIYRVSSVSGTTFSGAAEGADSNATAGSLVVGTMLTVDSLTQFQTDTIAATETALNAGGVLINAALPATAVTPGSYTNTSLTVNQKGVITAASSGSGGSGFIQPLTAPVSGNFTTLNFNTGSGVVTTQTNSSSPVTSINLNQYDPNTTQETAAIIKSPIASTFTLTVGITMTTFGTQGLGGLFLYDGSANNIVFGFQSGIGLEAAIFSNLSGSYTGPVFGPYNTTPLPMGPIVWLRIQETASARNYYISCDGINFPLIVTESNTAHFTTAKYGIACQNRSSTLYAVTLYSFAETNP